MGYPTSQSGRSRPDAGAVWPRPALPGLGVAAVWAAHRGGDRRLKHVAALAGVESCVSAQRLAARSGAARDAGTALLGGCARMSCGGFGGPEDAVASTPLPSVASPISKLHLHDL